MSQCRALAGKQWDVFFFLFSILSKHMVWHLFSQLCYPYHSQHGILSMLSLPFLFCLSVSVTWSSCLISRRLGGIVSNMLSEAQAAGVWSEEFEVREVCVWPEAKVLNLSEHWFHHLWSDSNYSHFIGFSWASCMWLSYVKVLCKLQSQIWKLIIIIILFFQGMDRSINSHYISLGNLPIWGSRFSDVAEKT